MSGNKKSLFRRIVGWLHLWLGLASGLVVLVVGLTGCIYVFRAEISALTETWREIPEDIEQPMLRPSELKSIAEKRLPGKAVRYVSYENNKAAYVGLFAKDYSYGVFIHPYSGQILKIKDFKKGDDFFSFILHGHRALWLPYEVGRPVVDYAILIFVLMLITGIILWWPKKWNKHNRKKSFTISWKARFKRLNYDLHNILGFYAMLVLLIIALTGLVWGFAWVSKSIYWLSSGGKVQPKFERPLSDTTINLANAVNQPVDSLWNRFIKQNRNEGGILFLFYPDTKAAAIQVSVNHQPGKNHDTEISFFDQYTLKPLKGGGIFAKPFKKAGAADQLSRLNYDIHTGQIGGLATKLLAFTASLIAASLPVTGFMIWLGRKKKKKKAKADNSAQILMAGLAIYKAERS